MKQKANMWKAFISLQYFVFLPLLPLYAFVIPKKELHTLRTFSKTVANRGLYSNLNLALLIPRIMSTSYTNGAYVQWHGGNNIGDNDLSWNEVSDGTYVKI